MAKGGYSTKELNCIMQELKRACAALPESLTSEQRTVYDQEKPMPYYLSEERIQELLNTPLIPMPAGYPAYTIMLDRQVITLRSRQQAKNLYKALTGKSLEPENHKPTPEDKIKEQTRKLKLEKTMLQVPLQNGKIVSVPGWVCQGLALHRTVIDGCQSSAWSITHVQSGLRLGKSWSNQAEAKTALARILPLADWTQPGEYFQIAASSKYLFECYRLMQNHGVYAEFPERGDAK